MHRIKYSDIIGLDDSEVTFNDVVGILDAMESTRQMDEQDVLEELKRRHCEND